jgi:GH24 family phage-related lysozyme (muramidase)
MELSYKGATGKTQSKLMSQHGLTAGEAKAEMRKFSLGMDMGLTQLENRLGGDDLQTKWMQKASSGFFKMTLLEDWTKFVQTSSFMSGKNLIEENIQALVAHGAKPLGKRQNTLIGELAELDIDYKDAMKWYKNGAKRNEEFYDKTFLAGAARYANSVILQPSGMSNLKPLLFSNPKTSIAFQLMGYPAAFTNTVLKGSIKQITKDVRSGDPRNVGKVAVTALSMVQVARIMNDWRSDGKSEEKGTLEANYQAVKRVGGLGILADNITKSYDAAKYNQSVLGYATLPFGPIATDVLSARRRGIAPTLVRKIPAAASPIQKILGIVDEEAAEIFKADMDHFVYKADKNLSEFEQGLIPEFEADGGMLGYATGGIVKNVPNVPTEPDERIDKITGLPYNAQAGDAYIDIEDRAKFSMGGRILAKNLVGAVQKASRLVTKRQPELDPDGAILHGIEDDLLDLNKSIKANRPSRDYQNVPLASRNEKVTTSFLDENGYTDYSGTGKKDFTYELMEDGSYKVYTPYVDAKGKEKLGVKTFKDPTLKQLRTYMGYAEGGLVERLQKFEGGVAVEEPSSILDTISKMASSAGVAILKHFDTAPNQEQLQQIEKVAKKIDAKTIEGVDQELMNEYKEGVIINALAVQGTPTTPDKKPKTYYGKNAISRVEEDEGELNSLQEYVVEHEGFVGGEYKDTKNIVTSGVGQTGKYKNMTFKEVFKIHQEEAKRYVPKFDSLSEKQQKALMSLVYRGDLQKSPTFRDRVNEGNFEQAAIELLDHKEYREYKRIAREGGNVSGIIGRLEEASEFIKG